MDTSVSAVPRPIRDTQVDAKKSLVIQRCAGAKRPPSCGECHLMTTGIRSNQQRLGFDHSMVLASSLIWRPTSIKNPVLEFESASKRRIEREREGYLPIYVCR